MIVARIEAGEPVLVPPALLAALGPQPGDETAVEQVGDHRVIAAVGAVAEPFVGDLSTFTEWHSEADRRAFDGD